MQILKLRKNSIFYQRVICLQFVHKACVYREELIDRIYKYFDEINEESVVYHWKYKMDETVI